MSFISRSLCTALLFAASVTGASAATLSGDTFTTNLTADVDYGDQILTAVFGDDGNYFGNQYFDVNDGVNGDILTISSTSSFSSIDGTGGQPVVWSFTGLNFSGGETLIGFNLLQSFSDVVASFTANSLTLTYTDTSIPAGTYLQGQFLTSGSTIAPVPLPASALLLAGGLFGMSAVKRRKSRKAA